MVNVPIHALGDLPPPSGAPLFSDPEQIARVSENNEATCHRLLKYFQPASGQWCIGATDVTAIGAEPLALQRIFLPPRIAESYNQNKDWDRVRLHEQLSRPGSGWAFLPELYMQARAEHDRLVYYVTDSNSLTLAFRAKPHANTYVLDMEAYGMHNGLQGLPSSRYDYRNSTLHKDPATGHMVFTTSDGVQRFYKFPEGACPFHHPVKGLLEKTRLRNGLLLRYSYKEQQIGSMGSCDPTGNIVYTTFSFLREQQDPSKQIKSLCTTTCESNTGARATWQEEVVPGHFKFKEKTKREDISHKYLLPPVRLLSSCHSSQKGDSSFAYQSRYICSDLATEDGKLRAEYGLYGSGAKRHYRINTLLRANDEGVYLPLYHFDYTLAEPGKSGGSTSIKLADNSSIIYKVNEKLLVDSIAWKDPTGKIRKEERFVWNDKQWCERKEIYADNALVLTYRYTYDQRGNPLVEEVSGDLTGDGSVVTHRIRRSFSQDALALLLSEERDTGRIDLYSYLPGTDCLQSHYVQYQYNGPICQRTVYVYNAQNQLIEKRVDDGSSANAECLDGVTECHITCWKLRQKGPFLHMPEQKEEYVLDQGKRKLITRVCYSYDAAGNVAKEERYDSQGQLLDTLSREYNAQGNVIAETNNLGQKSTRTYDDYGRKTGEVPFSGDRKIQWLRDNQGRCTSRIVTGIDNLERCHKFTYGLYDQQEYEIGPLGECTQRWYSSLSGYLLQQQKPSTLSLAGRGVPVVEKYGYDGLGRLIAQKHANGSVTKTKYTAYGKPCTIFHADGTQESFRYTVDGNLACYTDCEGMQTHYKWDIWNRLVAKTYCDEKGNTLAQESCEYSPFHLLRTTDQEGHVTKYTYDTQGRKVQEEAAPRCTRWKYDAKGDVQEITYVSAGNSLHVHMLRDALGRVIETHSKDDQGNLLKWEGVSYDQAGRVATQEYMHDGQRVTESFTYDTQDRLIRHQDFNGAITTTQYGEIAHTVNKKIHRIETKRIKSPEGEVTEIVYDHAGREWVRDQWDATGHQLLRKEHEYDPEGNPIYIREWLYDEDGQATLHIVARTYTPDNLVASVTRAAGSDLARTTKYVYSPEGRLISREEPSGRSVHYTYDGLGFLRSIQSSDQTVDQQLQFNRLGYLIKSVDGTTGLELQRTVDRFGSVLAEVFPCGKQMHRQYDARGRLHELEVTGLGSTRYTYDSLFLRSVEKLSPRGESIALHRYTNYDQDGWLTQELLAGGLGSLNYRRDAKGCLLEMHTPYATISQSFDTQDRLIRRTEEGQWLSAEHATASTSLHTSYTYDGLSQLLSEQKQSENSDDNDIATQTYQYDMQGSRLAKNGEKSEVNLLCEELLSGTHRFAYDLDGNRIEKTDLQKSGTSWTYTYNALHQCTEAHSDTCRVQFAYDALYRKSRRILERREDASQPWSEVDRLYFLYQGNEEVGSYRETGECTSYRVLAYPENSIIPRTVYMELEGNWYVPQVDAQGSITHVLDPRTAAIASIKRHTAFGEVLSAGLPSGLLTGFLESSSAESLASLSNVSCPWGYFSKRLDPDLGLIDFGKRWYDPQQARWTTLDPAGFIDGTNLYRFVRNNPLLYTDPDGQVAFVIPIFTATAVTWEGLAAVVAAVAAVLGAYQVYDAVGSSIEQQKEFELQQARAFGQDYKPKPLYTTTTEHKPKPKKEEEEEDPEWNNGSGSNVVKVTSESVNARENLNRKLRQLEQTQRSAVRTRTLPDGRIRYYEAERMARDPGRTRGAAMATEYNPATGHVRGWNECYNQAGNVNRVHPKHINGQEVVGPHYPPTAKEISQ